MTVKVTTCHYVRCDFPECRSELEDFDGGELHYDTVQEARQVARADEWVTDVDGRDFCAEHRDHAAALIESPKRAYDTALFEDTDRQDGSK